MRAAERRGQIFIVSSEGGLDKIIGQRKFKMRNEDRTNSYGEKLDIDEIQKIQILTPSLPPFPNVCH